jgi:hypothetical protein
MLRWLAVGLTMVAAAPDPAAARPAHTTGVPATGIHTSGAGQDARGALRPGAVGGSGVRAGGPATGANLPLHSGGRESSGWYQSGFGGTLNPGWGYGFGPNLGGLGH